MKDYKTTLVGVVSFLGLLANAYASNHFDTTTIISGLSALLIGIFAKDSSNKETPAKNG